MLILSQLDNTTGFLAQLQQCSRNRNIIDSDLLPPRGHALATGTRGGQRRGSDGARGNGNRKGGPALATDACGDDTQNGDVRGPPAQGKVTLYGTDTVAGAAANDAERCHEQGTNKRGATRQPTKQEGATKG